MLPLTMLRMTTALANRGPDERNIHVDEYIALGHSRLIVIDPAGL